MRSISLFIFLRGCFESAGILSIERGKASILFTDRIIKILGARYKIVPIKKQKSR